MTKSPEKKEVTLRREIVVNAPVGAVWKALTDAGELTKWFPLDARVVPGEGGKIFISWGPDLEAESEIVSWEPNRRFGWKDPLAVVEWTLEARGGTTVVRLVMSGFTSGADWEDEWFESSDYGWAFMLLSLRWLLEKRPVGPRHVAWARQKTPLARSEVYTRLVQAGGLFQESTAGLRAGDAVALTTIAGQRWTCVAQSSQAERGYCVSAAELDEALFWVTIEGAPGAVEAQVWISTFSLPQDEVDGLQRTWQARLASLLA